MHAKLRVYDARAHLTRACAQGFDYSGALRPAGSRLRRVHYVASEVYLLGVSGYAGVSNDYCAHTLPLMLSLGFEPVALLTWWSVTPDR